MPNHTDFRHVYLAGLMREKREAAEAREAMSKAIALGIFIGLAVSAITLFI